MSTYSLFFPPPAWTNQPVRLYHGTDVVHAAVITTSGVRIDSGKINTDFGKGFYTTTLERQALAWAWHIRRRRGGTPAVVYADVDRDALAALDWLAFVRGDFEADDFWSFVTHCRLGATDHARTGAGEARYDVISGPVTTDWEQRALMANTDQISFHTPRAEAVLNTATWRIL